MNYIIFFSKIDGGDTYVRFPPTDLNIYDKNDTYYQPWIEVYHSHIKIDSTSHYLITTDLEELWLDDIRIINNNQKTKRNQTQQAVVVLEEGYHSIKAIYNNCVNDGFPAIWRKPEIKIKHIDDKKFKTLTPKEYYR